MQSRLKFSRSKCFVIVSSRQEEHEQAELEVGRDRAVELEEAEGIAPCCPLDDRGTSQKWSLPSRVVGLKGRGSGKLPSARGVCRR